MALICPVIMYGAVTWPPGKVKAEKKYFVLERKFFEPVNDNSREEWIPSYFF